MPALSARKLWSSTRNQRGVEEEVTMLRRPVSWKLDVACIRALVYMRRFYNVGVGDSSRGGIAHFPMSSLSYMH